MKVHQIKIDFQVTKEVQRYVFVYVIEAESCYLIDSGVAGCQDVICAKLKQIGKQVSDVKGIFLTHAHPDHIGTAAWFREQSGCRIYASAGEKRWIENIDIQYQERPIPNFYRIAGRSVPVDFVPGDGDLITLEKGLAAEAVSTPGHSADGMSFRFGDCLFIGDSIPVRGDIPIYVDKRKTIESIARIEAMTDVKWFYPAWDKTYSREELKEKAAYAKLLVGRIDESVKRRWKEKMEWRDILPAVCEDLGMPWLMQNPLFAETVKCHLERR